LSILHKNEVSVDGGRIRAKKIHNTVISLGNDTS
jgi:hypothetical protein